MSLPRPRRLFVPLILALCLAGMAAGCSKKEDPLPPPPDMPEADVDDMAQHIAATTASDNGGWFFTVETMADSLAQPIAPRPGLALRPYDRFKALSNFSVTRAGMTYDWRLGYFDNNLIQHAVRDSQVEFLEASVLGQGSINGSGISAGTYGCSADSSQFTVEFIEPASDTTVFDLFVEDTSTALVSSVFHAGSNRVWNFSNLISTIENPLVVKASLPSPYPVSGTLEWSIDAKVLDHPPLRDQFTIEWLAEGEMTFDGTQFAVLKITVGFGLGSPIRSYKVNLKTGAITKI